MGYKDCVKIRRELEKVLKESRLEHTMGVAYTAASLAMRHGADAERALLAGYLHDCAKYLSGEELLMICEQHEISVSDTERKNPKALLHGKVGALFAKEKYGVQDEEILQAIRFHTTGRPDMSDLEKIIFLADYMEPGREKAPNLQQIRRQVFENLDQGMLMVLQDTLSYLEASDGEVDTQTEETYEYFKARAKL